MVWYDSYTKEKKVTASPIAERLAILYNLAVVYSDLVRRLLTLTLRLGILPEVSSPISGKRSNTF